MPAEVKWHSFTGGDGERGRGGRTVFTQVHGGAQAHCVRSRDRKYALVQAPEGTG